MPYYLHRPGVPVASLIPSSIPGYRKSRPDPSGYGPDRCDCAACAERFVQVSAERDAWDAAQLVGVESSPVLASFATMAEAHQAKTVLASPDPLVITFNPTETEKRRWRERESSRMGIDPLPWDSEAWQIKLNRLHHAYISIDKPGMVGYTPSEEWGHLDRQLAVRPGRYLEQFAAEETSGYLLHPTSDDPFDGEHYEDSKAAQAEKVKRGAHLWSVTCRRDAFCALVKALDERNTVRFASSAEDIETVYRIGPSSCMSHPTGDYSSTEHPVRVYGASDLQCAYLGSIVRNAPGRGVRARAMVWPERKIYSRVYGDGTLRILLERAGYTLGEGSSDYGNLQGARIRAVCHDSDADVWVMPYIDCCAAAVLSKDRKWFVLGSPRQYRASDFSPTVSTVYETRNQNGLTDGSYGAESDEYMCSHCGDHSVEDDGDECESCQDQRFHCAVCRDVCHEESPVSLAGSDDDLVCSSCIENGRVSTCESCNEYFAAERYARVVQRVRRDQGLSDYCEDCGNTELADRIDSLQAEALEWLAAVRAKEGKQIKARDRGVVLRAHSLDGPSAPLVPPVVDRSVITIRSVDGSEVVAAVRARFGAFVVHPPVLDLAGRRGWVVTHEPSTRRACRVKSLADAEALARELLALGDWVNTVSYPAGAAAVVARYAVSARELV